MTVLTTTKTLLFENSKDVELFNARIESIHRRLKELNEKHHIENMQHLYAIDENYVRSYHLKNDKKAKDLAGHLGEESIKIPEDLQHVLQLAKELQQEIGHNSRLNSITHYFHFKDGDISIDHTVVESFLDEKCRWFDTTDEELERLEMCQDYIKNLNRLDIKEFSRHHFRNPFVLDVNGHWLVNVAFVLNPQSIKAIGTGKTWHTPSISNVEDWKV